MYAEPFMEIFAQVFRLFPFNKLRHNRLIHPFLPGNGSGPLIDGNVVLLLFWKRGDIPL
ncbi:hypothetical protein NUKP79_49100 [Klebsiella quasipneumoniae]|nr:hypothetical protein NUKP79_49100 [Klebsiella quasipneumoniae]